MTERKRLYCKQQNSFRIQTMQPLYPAYAGEMYIYFSFNITAINYVETVYISIEAAFLCRFFDQGYFLADLIAVFHAKAM